MIFTRWNHGLEVQTHAFPTHKYMWAPFAAISLPSEHYTNLKFGIENRLKNAALIKTYFNGIGSENGLLVWRDCRPILLPISSISQAAMRRFSQLLIHNNRYNFSE